MTKFVCEVCDREYKTESGAIKHINKLSEYDSHEHAGYYEVYE